MNFTTKLTVVSFPSPDWKDYLRTQFEGSKRFFWALFSRIIFFALSRHLKELQLKGNLIDCPQIWTVARLTFKKQKLRIGHFEILLLRELSLYDQLTFS